MERRGFLTGLATGLVVGAGGAYLAVRNGGQRGKEGAARKTLKAPAIAKGLKELRMVPSDVCPGWRR